MLHENDERKSLLVDAFYGDNSISAHFFRPNFEQVYLPWHLIAMVPIASPSCTEIALLALRWSWKLDMWASCWNRPTLTIILNYIFLSSSQTEKDFALIFYILTPLILFYRIVKKNSWIVKLFFHHPLTGQISSSFALWLNQYSEFTEILQGSFNCCNEPSQRVWTTLVNLYYPSPM